MENVTPHLSVSHKSLTNYPSLMYSDSIPLSLTFFDVSYPSPKMDEN